MLGNKRIPSRTMKMVTLGLLYIALFAASGCAGLGDYDISLPGGYAVVRTSAHEVAIRKQEGEGVWGGEIVPAKVVQVGWDDRYILAKQAGLRNDPKRTDGSYQIPDETIVAYWIVDPQTNEVYGPMTEENFAARKKALGIEESVTLKAVDSLH